MSVDQLLDYRLQGHIELVRASREKRALNFLIDIIASFLMLFLVKILFYIVISIWSLLIIYFLYYFIAESVFDGKTIGKQLTKTRVVTRQGMSPQLNAFLVRTLIRLTIIDIVTFYDKEPKGWHDVVSKTIVIDEVQSKL